MAVLRCVAGVDQIGSGGGVENWTRQPPDVRCACATKIDCGQTNHPIVTVDFLDWDASMQSMAHG